MLCGSWGTWNQVQGLDKETPAGVNYPGWCQVSANFLEGLCIGPLVVCLYGGVKNYCRNGEGG